MHDLLCWVTVDGGEGVTKCVTARYLVTRGGGSKTIKILLRN